MGGQVIRNAAIVVLFSTVVASAGGIVLRGSHWKLPGKTFSYQPKARVAQRAISKKWSVPKWGRKPSWSGARHQRAGHWLGRSCFGQKYDLCRLAHHAWKQPPVKQRLQSLWKQLPKHHRLRSLVDYKHGFPHHHHPRWPWHPRNTVSPCNL